MLSAICFNFDQSKILLSGNGLYKLKTQQKELQEGNMVKINENNDGFTCFQMFTRILSFDKDWLVFKGFGQDRSKFCGHVHKPFWTRLSFSPDFSIFRSIWMWNNFQLAKHYSLEVMLLGKSWRKRYCSWEWLVEYGPLSSSKQVTTQSLILTNMKMITLENIAGKMRVWLSSPTFESF